MVQLHLHRFHNDDAQHLTGYGVFYGNDSQPAGPPPGTGTLRASPKPWPQHSSSTGRLLGTAQDFSSTGGQVKSTVSLQSLMAASGGKTRTLGTYTPNGTLAGTQFHYNDGTTYVSKSGERPNQMPW